MPLLVALLAFFAAGCGSSREAGTENRALSWATFHASVQNRLSSIHSLSGEGRLSVETPEFAQNGSFTFALKKPDSLLFRIQGPFGIKVGALQLAGDSLRFYSAIENKLAVGTSDPQNLERVLRMNISTDDLMDLLAGGGILRQDRSMPDSMFSRDGSTVLAYHDDSQIRWYTVDASGELRSIQVFDRQKKLVLEQTFDDLRIVGSTTLPFQLKTIRPRERQRFILRFQELQLNEAVDLTFAVPSSAEIVRWR